MFRTFCMSCVFLLGSFSILEASRSAPPAPVAQPSKEDAPKPPAWAAVLQRI